MESTRLLPPPWDCAFLIAEDRRELRANPFPPGAMDPYILRGREIVGPVGPTRWGYFLVHGDRRVALTRFGAHHVSTVFMGVDHNVERFLHPEQPPILFETMVFSPLDPFDELTARYATWEEAEDGHWRAVGLLLRALPGGPLAALAGWADRQLPASRSG